MHASDERVHSGRRGMQGEVKNEECDIRTFTQRKERNTK